MAVPRARAGLLAGHLGPAGPQLQILDMFELGRNPARIIPAVLRMIERHQGRMLYYVGEPVWPGRGQEEIQEATRHEALINLAWPGAQVRVLCPYDAAHLHDDVLGDARMTHPWVVRQDATARSPSYSGWAFPQGTDSPLPEPPPHAATMRFGLPNLAAVRALVASQAAVAGLPRGRSDDLIIAVNEVATNAIKHAEAGGRLWVWSTPTELICQLQDPGHIGDPLAGPPYSRRQHRRRHGSVDGQPALRPGRGPHAR